MKKFIFALLTIGIGLLPVTTISAAPIKIVASLPDLGSIAAYIGGDKVEVSAIGKPTNNPHAVEVLPSYMVIASRAAIYLKVGLALDQWADGIIDGSRNNRLVVVDCAEGVSVLQKPIKVDASMGDVHPEGNPHYWLDPANGVIIAGNILKALKKIDPANSSFYENNFNDFKAATSRRSAAWKEKMAALSGQKVICYHSSWVYFAAAFNLTIAGNVEPVPGIPPTGKHLDKLVNMIKEDKITILLQEPYFPNDAPQFLNRQTGIKVYKISPSCQGVKANDYFDHFDDIISRITG
jgi:zinc/manganese transport system substrate-binding protein